MLRTVAIASPWRRILNGLIITALGGSLSNLLIQNPTLSEKIETVSDLIFVVFLGVAIATLSHQLNQSIKVDQDIIVGAICVYLLLGIFWFLLYRITFSINPDNFTDLQVGVDNPDFTLLYFSFTTLTTVGYGDITPTASAAMGLANLESIMGQLFPAIFIARLVGLYTVTLQEGED
ncbi:MAG: ion channel [Synechocystis sp.]